LQVGSIKADSDKEIIALIAYLQRLGADIKAAASAPAPATAPAQKTAQVTTPNPVIN